LINVLIKWLKIQSAHILIFIQSFDVKNICDSVCEPFTRKELLNMLVNENTTHLTYL